ncbi:MAG: excinuclease ABC subunit UvrC [Gammaproteobacteria bacterium]|nr:excinuclease ABC subunit UvrC [Gammaproteobacteria bacterium]
MPYSQKLLDSLKTLPRLPGVYRFLSSENKVLYVGKAVDLYKRVGSYFRQPDTGTRIGYMVTQIESIDITVVQSEAEALILELNLIKTLKPKYNILFRDDKSYPYLVISKPDGTSQDKDQKPPWTARLAYYRGSLNKNYEYFGPYPNPWAVKESIALLQKAFQIRTCEDTIYFNRSRPCLLYQIKRCSAPCVGKIGANEYAQQIQLVKHFLQGKTSQIFKTLEDCMTQHAENLEFEQAAVLRNQIVALGKMLHQQVHTRVPDVDLISVHRQGESVGVNLSMVRGQRYLGDKMFFPQQAEKSTLEEVLLAFISQHYAYLPPPTWVVTQPELPNEFVELITKLSPYPWTIKHKVNGVLQKWMLQAQENTKLQLSRHILTQSTQTVREQNFCEILQWASDDDLKIECFDISHSSGEATYASCVVYAQHQLQPKLYRRYSIKGITGGDDYAAMQQALTRHYKNYIDDPQLMPHFVLIDGGVGQVQVAKRVFEALGLATSVLMGIEKGEHRKIGLEELVFADGREKLAFSPQAPALLFIAAIRDEAHRFAISGMRRARSQQRLDGGQLQDIVGVGAKRRASLIRRFGSVRGVKLASIEDLTSVEGISQGLAEQIFQYLHPSNDEPN